MWLVIPLHIWYYFLQKVGCNACWAFLLLLFGEPFFETNMPLSGSGPVMETTTQTQCPCRNEQDTTTSSTSAASTVSEQRDAGKQGSHGRQKEAPKCSNLVSNSTPQRRKKKYTTKLRRANSNESDGATTVDSTDSRTTDDSPSRAKAQKRKRTEEQTESLVAAQLHALKRVKQIKGKLDQTWCYCTRENRLICGFLTEYHKDKHGRRGAICVGQPDGEAIMDALSESLKET